MNNELTTYSAMVNYNPGRATLLEMRADPKQFPRLKDLPREQAEYGMTKIITQAFIYKSMEADPQTIGMIASSVVDNLLDDGGTGSSLLSLAEIQVVVRRAVTRTEMYGISVANITKAIMDYVTGEGHANQKQVEQMIKDSRNTENAKSPVTNMMQAFAGAFLRNNKINK